VGSLGLKTKKEYILAGILLVCLTLLFEYIFGYFVMNRSLEEINAVFDIFQGDLFIFVLLTSAASPWLAAKIRSLL
jgi:hypothetical protein